MGYTYYNPLKVWLDPASIADVVSYMQKYLSENPIKDTEEINQIIADYIAAHPEIIGGVQSVNGETGDVVLTASDINTTGATTIQAVLTSLSSQISEITQTVTQNTNDITDLKSAVDLQKSNLKKSPHIPTVLSWSDLLSFEKVKCIHSDNFHRADNSTDIGYNGNTNYPMAYTTLSQNVTEANDMQVGISNNRAVGFNANNVTTSRRKIKAVDAGRFPYKITVGFENMANIVVGVKNINDYFQINIMPTSVTVQAVGAVVGTTASYTHNSGISVCDLYVFKDHIAAAVGGQIVFDTPATVETTVCGMLFRAGSISQWIYKSFSVFVPATWDDIGYDKTIEESTVIYNNKLIGATQLPNQTYSCTFDNQVKRFNKKSLKFDLRYGDTYGDSVRSEIAPPKQINDMGFKSEGFEFDVFFPADYAADTEPECFFQLHHEDDGINFSGADPNIMLSVENDHVYLLIRGAENHLAASTDEVSEIHDLGALAKGAWHRYSIFWRQSYIPDVTPITALYVDGELIVLSNALNMYNSPYSGYPKYGIYKWPWKAAASDVNERVIYFDNVNIWR